MVSRACGPTAESSLKSKASRMRLRSIVLLIVCLSPQDGWAANRGLTNTSASPYVKLHSIDIDAVRWTEGFWAQRCDWCRRTVIPNMWRLLEDPEISHAYENFRVAAGQTPGRHLVPAWRRICDGLARNTP